MSTSGWPLNVRLQVGVGGWQGRALSPRALGSDRCLRKLPGGEGLGQSWRTARARGPGERWRSGSGQGLEVAEEGTAQPATTLQRAE